jgi:hypothetical protein
LNRIGTALRDLEKLREEATEVGRRKIRRLFLEDNLGSENRQQLEEIEVRQLWELQFWSGGDFEERQKNEKERRTRWF